MTFPLRLVVAALFAAPALATAADVKSRRSGNWSDAATWDAGRPPAAGDRVLVRAGHRVAYDVDSRDTLRVVQIAGELDFARDKSTTLEAGLITITADEELAEDGFGCHSNPRPTPADRPRPALLVGRPGAPLPVGVTATIRLRYVDGMDKVSCPALVCCGGRLELYGSPVARTWVKLKRPADVGTTNLALAEAVDGWKDGDQIIVTSTRRQLDRRGGGDFLAGAETEQRKIVRVGRRDFTGGYPVTLDKPLTFAHYADDGFQAEVANLSRNVVVESADPDGVRGHTMFHKHSAGAVHYAEFRHLGKRDELGRYSLHFHLAGDTMRGSSVIGASIWDSHNRWITVHGTNALVIRDCVGFKSVGHGYFLEDGTEVNNVLDHNLAALVLPATPQRNQVVPFDLNRGAGFWWANCQNSFTRNVAAECAEYGYRFDCKKTDDYDPVRPVRQPDGTVKPTDTRVLPFLRFEDNEAHTMKFFCLNLRGIARPAGGGPDFYGQTKTLAREAAEAMPEPGKPFWVRNFKAWEANWSVHLGTTGVFVDGLDSFRSDVAVWRSVMDRSGFRRMTSKDMRVNDIHNPLSIGLQDDGEGGSRRGFGGVSSFRDELPPVTTITGVVRDGNVVVVRGSVADTSDIKGVAVNGRAARSVRGSFAEWEVAVDAPGGKPVELSAAAVDVNGHAETTPHVVRVE